MGGRIADGRGLGFGAAGAFFLGAGLAYSPWFSPEVLFSPFGTSMTLFAGGALLLAAVAAFLRGERLHASFFGFLAALTWAGPNVVDAVWSTGGAFEDVEGSVAWTGWVLFGYALINLTIGVAGLRGDEMGPAGSVAVLGVATGFLANALAHWGAPPFLYLVVGGAYLTASAAAFWAARTALGVSGAEAEEGSAAA